MAEYKVSARRYRPQSFKDVLGQDAVVTTLKNALKRQQIAHAYLFCGSRGTGKTTLARIFAKALNCKNPTADFDPCNQCSSCKEITSGHSLDILEIDGASHRGIDDIRQINETVGYAASSGKYKIYIIDEVHMLTKEAFNALLKTLEEPPPQVKFFFATTEPHKMPATVLSRCQRFNLNRIPISQIKHKLQMIAQDLGVSIQEEALHLLAQTAEGGLRDAESLFDQIVAFNEGEITSKTVASILGMMPRDALFALDKAGKEGDLSVAFEIAHQVFAGGKDIGHFLEDLTQHFRTLLLIKLATSNAPFLTIHESEKEQYDQSAKLYSKEQCLTILDLLVEAQGQKSHVSERIHLEAILLRILRIHQRIPVDFLVKRLIELENSSSNQQPIIATPIPVESPPISLPKDSIVKPKVEIENPPAKAISPEPISVSVDLSRETLTKKENIAEDNKPIPKKKTIKSTGIVPPTLTTIVPQQNSPILTSDSISEDPTPSPAEFPKNPQSKPFVSSPKAIAAEIPQPIPTPPAPIELGAQPTEETRRETIQIKSRIDTLLQFATVELEGTLKRKSSIGGI